MSLRCARLVLGLAAVSAACGCLKLDQRLQINRDGSGLIELKYSIAEQTIARLTSMRKLQTDLAAVSGRPNEEDEATRYAYMLLMPTDEAIRRELLRYKPLGVEIERLKVETRSATRHVDLKARFQSVANLARTDIYRHCGFSLVKDSEGNYVFHREATPEQRPAPPDYGDSETVKMLSPLLGGFDVTVRVEVPGQILRTNAPRRGERTAEWNYSFEQNPAALTLLQTHKLIIVFRGKGLELPSIRFRGMQPLDAAAPANL